MVDFGDRFSAMADDGSQRSDGPQSSGEGQYVVVARRYRPQTFNELIGQEHVGRGLSNAINLNRVGHAYLFTGARGVGKTSSARILAKALNCVDGPTPTPCNECEICRSISAGEDIDVLEIDGASNRGIDEIRQLRQNVNVRPSRARYKIYIIDEVHMLTREAFNALLKTLEEPPERVKFIFCTTEPEKIPITILSRCQRFDFAGIQAPSIVERLAQIAHAEGVEAEREALEILARRAAGSMRDSQSLLEQLLAFGGKTITAASVHEMLGTASGARLAKVVNWLVQRDAAQALAELDGALTEGVDVGQFLDQLLGYLRDCMAAAVGSKADAFLNVSSSEADEVIAASKKLGLDTTLAMIQILDQTLSRLRFSSHGRTLAEMALVRMCRLDDLESLPDLIAELRGGATSDPTVRPRTAAGAAADDAKKKATVARVDLSQPEIPPAAAAISLAPQDPPAVLPESLNQAVEVEPAVAEVPARTLQPSEPAVLTQQNVAALWEEALDRIGGLMADWGRFATVSLDESQRSGGGSAIVGPNSLVATFPVKYNSIKRLCEGPDAHAEFEKALRQLTGNPVRIQFRVSADLDDAPVETVRPKPVSKQQRMAEKSKHVLVTRAVELFDARVVKMDEPTESS